MLLSCIHSAAHAAQQRRANAVMLELVYANPPSTCMECVHKTDQIYIYSRNVVSVTRDGAGSSATQGLHLRLFESETDAASHLLPLLPSSLSHE